MKISLKFVPKESGSNYQYSITSSDNGVAPSRQWTAICNKDVYFIDAYVCHSASMS